MTKLEKTPLTRLYATTTQKAAIVKDLCELFDDLEEEYEAELLLRAVLKNDYNALIKRRIEQIKENKKELEYEVLNNDSILKKLNQNSKKKAKILEKIKKIADSNRIFFFNHVLKLFTIMIDIKDYALGGTMTNIAKKHEIGDKYVRSIAKIVNYYSKESDFYRTRFYKPEYLNEDVMIITDAVLNNEITPESFSNLCNAQFQDLLKVFRKEKRTKTGFTLFYNIELDLDFIKLISNLSNERLNKILKNHAFKHSKKEFLVMCSYIKKNYEILKFIIFSIIKCPINEFIISEITGKGINFIRKCEKLIYNQFPEILDKIKKSHIRKIKDISLFY